MSFSKKMLAFAAVTALSAATAVPAMALENEFHGMYKFMGYQTNIFNGGSLKPALRDGAHSGFFAEQRARIQYTAKANDNLKLVTHFELDSRFGGVTGEYKGAGNDGGNLDADQLTLETKNVYLDFNCPVTGANVKAGIQPWADSYGSLFLLADMTGLYATKKFDPATVSLGWFRYDDNTTNAIALAEGPGERTADLIVLDGKFAINKDMTVGASYYNVQNDTGAGTEFLNVLGANADLKFGPAAIKPFAAYQFGEQNGSDDISAFLLGATAKVKAGPGTVNLAGYYMSGDDDGGDNDDFKIIGANTSYFNASNMWLLVRSGQAVNSSSSVLTNDLTNKGRGSIGLFGGYEGTVDKMFYNANIGYMMTAEDNQFGHDSIGAEINAQVGYKVYDNLSASVAAAYVFADDVLDDLGGQVEIDDPYLLNVQLAYTF